MKTNCCYGNVTSYATQKQIPNIQVKIFPAGKNIFDLSFRKSLSYNVEQINCKMADEGRDDLKYVLVFFISINIF